MNELKSIVKKLISHKHEEEWFEFKENWLSLMRWENIFPVCPMQRQWWARNMRTLYGE